MFDNIFLGIDDVQLAWKKLNEINSAIDEAGSKLLSKSVVWEIEINSEQ